MTLREIRTGSGGVEAGSGGVEAGEAVADFRREREALIARSKARNSPSVTPASTSIESYVCPNSIYLSVYLFSN